MIFKGGTIRVVSPKTEDGNRPKIDPVTKQVEYREDFFPASAKKVFEEQNKKLPQHLQKTIELLDGDYVAPKQEAVGQSEVSEPLKVKGKPGPKPKDHAQSN